MKRILALLLLCPALYAADTYTTNAGLVKPEENSTGWGEKLRDNYDIIDSSFACLGVENTFTAVQHFDGAVRMHGGGIGFYDTGTQTKQATIQNLTTNQTALIASASDGFYVNGGIASPLIPADIIAGGVGATTYGRFAVVGSSQDASTAYSGFMATGPITQSVLWTLPRADGTNGQPLVTDGASHLSFSSTISSVSITSLYVVSGGSITSNASSPNKMLVHMPNGLAMRLNGAPGFGGTPEYVDIASDHIFFNQNIAGPSNFGHIDFANAGSSTTLWGVDPTWGSPPSGFYFLRGPNEGTPLFYIGRESSTINAPGGLNVRYGISATTITVSTLTFSPSASSGWKGTVTNDDAAGGFVGQWISSVSVASSNFPATGAWGDLVAITLGPGDWDITAVEYAQRNGATFTGGVTVGISSTSGNSSAGLSAAYSFLDTTPPTVTNDNGIGFPNFRASMATSTTWYLKYFSSYSAGPPKAYGNLSARRRR